MDIFNYHYSKVKVGAQQNVPGSGNALNFAIFYVNENPCNPYFFLFHFANVLMYTIVYLVCQHRHLGNQEGKSKIAQNEKRQKNYIGFLIHT